jgi:hypothetical protein
VWLFKIKDMATITLTMKRMTGQSGIATVAVAFLLLLVMGLAVLGAESLTQGVARDAAAENDRLQALYLAHSGIERATYRFNNGVACASLGESSVSVTSVGTVTITSFTTDFDGVTSIGGSNCRVRAAATSASGQVVRTIEAKISPTAQTSTRGNVIFTCDIASGTNLGLIVTVSWAANGAYGITGVSFGGVGATSIDTTPVSTMPASITDSGTTYRAHNFYLANPTTGTDVDGLVSFSGNPSGLIIGCNVLAGVSNVGVTLGGVQTPIDVFGSGTGSAGNPTVTIHTSPTSGTRYVIDNFARDNSGSASLGTGTNGVCTRTSEWNSGAGFAAGAASNCGTVSSGTDVTMNWSWNKNKVWADAVVAAFATSLPHYEGARTRTAGSTSAQSGWREITVPPT